jgi:hypothetical protein
VLTGDTALASLNVHLSTNQSAGVPWDPRERAPVVKQLVKQGSPPQAGD